MTLPRFETAIEDSIDNKVKELHTALPGTIISFDIATQLCSVQLGVQRIFNGNKVVTLPPIINAPLAIYRGGGFALTFPVKPGDECLVIFSERSIDNWVQNGGIHTPLHKRTHDLSDGIVFPCLASQPNAIPGYDGDNVFLGRISGSILSNEAKITLNNDGTIKIQNMNGSISIEDNGRTDILGGPLVTPLSSSGVPGGSLPNGSISTFLDEITTTLNIQTKSSSGTVHTFPIGSGGVTVSSVFGREGSVSPMSGDYNTSQVSESTNLYFTNARAISAPLTGLSFINSPIISTDTILQGLGKAQGQLNSLVTGVSSVFGRQGAITAQSGDYTTSLVTEGSNLYFTSARTLSSALSGLSIVNSPIVSTDTILQAFGKTQGQLNALTTGVSSVFGRTGAVLALSGDYTTSLVTEGSNLYYTDSRVRSCVLTGFSAENSPLASSDTVLVAFNKVQGQISALITGVSSVFGRSGSVVAMSGDYTAAQVTNAADLSKLTLQTFLGPITVTGNLTSTSALISNSPAGNKGTLQLKASNNAGNTNTIINNNSFAQATMLMLPDPGVATTSFLLTDNLSTQAVTSGNIALTGASAILSAPIVQAGANGTVGIHSVFPAGNNKGSLQITAANNMGNTITSIVNASFGQASTITLPDPAASTAKFLLDTGSGQMTSGSTLYFDKGTGTVSAGAVTINSQAGVITTESLATAAGASTSFTFNNTKITATSAIQLQDMVGTNTTRNFTLSATASSGSSTITVYNNNGLPGAALNGTIKIAFLIC